MARFTVQGAGLLPAGGPVTQSYEARPARELVGGFAVPGDKSISHRALMLSGIAEGRSEVTGFLPSEDCLASMRAMQALGVAIERPAATRVIVEGAGMRGLRRAAGPLDMGNAGTAMRLFTGLLSAQDFDSVLVGDSSLMRRPMERVAKPLREMGADVRTAAGGTPPVDVRGGRPLRGIEYAMPVASAQVKSAIMLAGLYADGPTTVLSPAVSRDHSERMLQSFGVRVDVQDLSVRVHPPKRLAARDVQVPGDFSSAAFFIVAGLLGAGDGGLLIENVGLNPSRTGLLEILRLMGAEIEVVAPRQSGAEPVADLRVRRSALQGIEVPKSLVPLAIDEFPVLFVAAACARGETLITGAEELRVKESDRIAAMSAGFEALGVAHEVLADGMRIGGGEDNPFDGGTVDSHGDHRIAMAFTVASLRARRPIRILDVANVATSFPGFVALARSVGIDVHES
ncbi:MAG: 3-phosphoshikimate 1-carboxyvinyltransferase [Gammaproteobacteria bacterium]|nr:3-phosphoshikimate 1-carboxyvinyltransferase [Gammaproteobacteria bacterium]